MSAPEWHAIPAVAKARVFLAPSLPFGFIDSPLSVNRLIGLQWLLHRLYPDQTTGDLRQQVRGFFHLFYRVDLDDTALNRLLGS